MATDQVYPPSLPSFLIGRQIDIVDAAERTSFESGEQRVRQLFRSVPMVCSAAALYTQDQFDTWDEFHETDLIAGSLPFDVEIAKQGGTGVEWWTAFLISPYTWQTVRSVAGMHYRVSANLLLTGEPFAERVSTTLRGRGTVLFSGSGALTVQSTLFARGAFTFSGVGMLSTSGGDELREDGDNELREDGGLQLRE